MTDYPTVTVICNRRFKKRVGIPEGAITANTPTYGHRYSHATCLDWRWWTKRERAWVDEVLATRMAPDSMIELIP